MLALRRRLALILGLAALGLSLGPSLALAYQPEQPTDMTMGSPKAKVTVIEYASLSCSHCAHFNNEVFPAFKAKYIDTGKVRYVYREFYTPPVEIAAAGALIARCAGRARYFTVIDTWFQGQAEMYKDGDASGMFKTAGKAGGLSEDQVTACLKDEAAIKALNNRVQAYAEQDKITFTPTLVVGGKLLDGDASLAGLSAAIDPLLKGGKAKH